jgi:hypothetical protein
MANWAWPYTPSSNFARVLLVGGPFVAETAGFLPPDTPAPVQVVWGVWFPWGFSAYLYEWHGERIMDRGRTDALVYRSTGRQVPADDIPPAIADAADEWCELAITVRESMGLLVLPEVL